MSRVLPNEIILNISTQVGEDSSLDLRPLTLIDHQWHTVVASSLLSTISVSSLGNLLELCDHLTSLNERSSIALRSAMPKNTTTIVIDGVIWAPRADCHIGLEGLGEVGRTDEEESDDPDEPDVPASFAEVVSKLRMALPLLTALDGLEWYGRFAGDYHLVRYLQKAKVIRHMSYGIDFQAFLFENLKTLKITSEYEPEADMFPFVANMMHRNPDLEEILFDCKYAESMNGRWSLQEVICKDQKPFVWPNLKRLALYFFRGDLWQSAEEIGQLVEFFVAHPHLETLVLRETCLEDSQSETALPLSLSTHPGALPVLEKLLGSPRLIAGILESPAACAALTTIIDNSEIGFDAEGAKAPYIDRILAALKTVPNNPIRRCTLEVPQLNRSVYAAFADAAPNIQFLEFQRDRFGLAKPTSNDKNFNPLVDIPASLNAFPKLDTVGSDIVVDFVGAFGGDKEAALLDLATRVPRLRAIHCGQGKFLTILRGANGAPSLSKGQVYMDNSDYDWNTFAVDWRHRPMPRRKALEIWRSDRGEYNEIRLIDLISEEVI